MKIRVLPGTDITVENLPHRLAEIVNETSAVVAVVFHAASPTDEKPQTFTLFITTGCGGGARKSLAAHLIALDLQRDFEWEGDEP